MNGVYGFTPPESTTSVNGYANGNGNRIDKGKGKARAESSRTLPAIHENSIYNNIDDGEGDDDDDIEAAMDAELRAALNLNRPPSGDNPNSEDEGDEHGDEEPPMDYTMIRNFLESFKSQAGLAGPVSSLAGRLEPGWVLPRDEK